MKPVRLGIIGAGNIFPAYLQTLRRSRRFEITGLADADPTAAQRRAAETGLRALPMEALLEGPAEIILNLTPPAAHHAVGMKVLAAGKHLFGEKPLAATYAEGRELVGLAARLGLRIGCAPDTFLGAGAQALRALVDAGSIGTVRHGTAHFMNHGPDDWHPNPGFFYRPGAGPLLDVGVYYVTHLVHVLGPVAQLHGSAHLTHQRRTITAGPNAGRTIDVEVPTHLTTQLGFASGAAVVLTSSFDVWRHGHGPIELYGDEGSALGHDPNRFGGSVRWARRREDWQRAPGGRPYHANCRGIGLVDMALALAEGRDHRCNERLALHVLEVLDRAVEAGLTGRTIRLETRCERPAPLDGRLS